MAGRGLALVVLLLLGLFMWIAGAGDFIPGAPLVSIGMLLGGGIQIVLAAAFMLDQRPSGKLAHSADELLGFCVCCGTGLASIGLAISPLTSWLLPATLFVAGGIALIAWAPQAFAGD